MDYKVFQLLIPYINNKSYIFYAFVCKDWLKLIKLYKSNNDYFTSYNILILSSLLKYSEE